MAAPDATPHAQHAEPSAPINSSDKRIRAVTLALGFVFLFAMAAAGFLLFAVTGGGFLPAHWVVFYIIVALVTGLGFWLITGATGEFTWKEFGWKLGGGAAVGMIFMFAAHKITPEQPPNIRVIEVIFPDGIEPVVSGFDHGASRVIRLVGEPRYLVEFREGAMTGDVHFHYVRSGERYLRTYHVPRVGTVGEPQERKSDQ